MNLTLERDESEFVIIFTVWKVFYLWHCIVVCLCVCVYVQRLGVVEHFYRFVMLCNLMDMCSCVFAGVCALLCAGKDLWYSVLPWTGVCVSILRIGSSPRQNKMWFWPRIFGKVDWRGVAFFTTFLSENVICLTCHCSPVTQRKEAARQVFMQTLRIQRFVIEKEGKLSWFI